MSTTFMAGSVEYKSHVESTDYKSQTSSSTSWSSPSDS